MAAPLGMKSAYCNWCDTWSQSIWVNLPTNSCHSCCLAHWLAESSRNPTAEYAARLPRIEKSGMGSRQRNLTIGIICALKWANKVSRQPFLANRNDTIADIQLDLKVWPLNDVPCASTMGISRNCTKPGTQLRMSFVDDSKQDSI